MCFFLGFLVFFLGVLVFFLGFLVFFLGFLMGCSMFFCFFWFSLKGPSKVIYFFSFFLGVLDLANPSVALVKGV